MNNNEEPFKQIEITKNTKAIIIQFDEILSDEAYSRVREKLTCIADRTGIEFLILDNSARVTELKNREGA